ETASNAKTAKEARGIGTDSPELPGFAEGEVNPMATHQRMMGFLERHDPVIAQSGRPTPHHYVAMRQLYPARLVGSTQPTEQEDGWNAQRHGDNRLPKILLVLVLVERQPGTRLVAIDEAGIRDEPPETAAHRRVVRQLQKGVRQLRPSLA